MPKAETVPHPFVIEPPEDERTRLDSGETLLFGLTLVGRAIDHVPYFILAFEQMAEQGLGTGRARFRLLDVSQNGMRFYDPESASLLAPLQTHELAFETDAVSGCSQLTVHFLTPTRIIHHGRMSRRPQFHVLINSLLRRLRLLSCFHDQPLQVDQQRLIAKAGNVKLADAVMAGADWHHYSSRQQRVVEREGMTGWVRYEGELGPFLPFLRAGEILHVGKGTAFGMGKYEMEVR
uniref:CRISPR system precrRNA processing endoribonuclease RAMP protein Cas6 n=1 Tax=candidate division WOR-3 bacterium TaxID=2052148 RepID=A0A7C4CBE6_UNCW3